MNDTRNKDANTHIRYVCMNCHKDFTPDLGPHVRGLFCSYDCEYSYMTRQSESNFINWCGYMATRIERELEA